MLPVPMMATVLSEIGILVHLSRGSWLIKRSGRRAGVRSDRSRLAARPVIGRHRNRVIHRTGTGVMDLDLLEVRQLTADPKSPESGDSRSL
jgi:hypothetical protein